MQSKPETIDTVLATPRRALRRRARDSSKNSSRRRKARSTASAAGSASPSRRSRSSSPCSISTPPTRSCRRMCCGPTHVGMVLVLCFLLFPMAHAVPRPHPLVGLSARRRERRHDRSTCSRQGAYFGDRATDADDDRLAGRRRLHRAAARGDAPRHRLDHAGRRHRFPALCPLRQLSAAAVDASRLSARGSRRPPLHDAGRHLRHHGRRRVQPDHPVHRSSAPCCSIRAPAASSSTSRSRRWAAGATRPAAPWCCPRSCWAALRAPASPPR